MILQQTGPHHCGLSVPDERELLWYLDEKVTSSPNQQGGVKELADSTSGNSTSAR